MRKIREFLFIIFILGLILGIIPALGVALIFKFPILLIPIIIFIIYWLLYNICYEGE